MNTNNYIVDAWLVKEGTSLKTLRYILDSGEEFYGISVDENTRMTHIGRNTITFVDSFNCIYSYNIFTGTYDYIGGK